MKGIILAGGLGTRLHPLTKITNKHLLPVYNKPMIYYPLETLITAGIHNILLVAGGNNAGDFLKLLGNGAQFGLKHLNYTYQHGEGGIAEALGLAEYFADKDKIAVILGDNIIEDNITPFVEEFKKQSDGAKILLKEIPEPNRFGVPVLEGSKIIRIEEKPAIPKSPYAVTGIYMYDHTVFDIIKGLKPSERGELEITDVNNAYLSRDNLTYNILRGWWTDAGTPESLFYASQLVKESISRSRVIPVR